MIQVSTLNIIYLKVYTYKTVEWLWYCNAGDALAPDLDRILTGPASKSALHLMNAIFI